MVFITMLFHNNGSCALVYFAFSPPANSVMGKAGFIVVCLPCSVFCVCAVHTHTHTHTHILWHHCFPCACPSVWGWPIRSDLSTGWTHGCSRLFLLQGIDVTISRKQPRKQLSNVQFREDFGPGSVFSLSASSSLPLLWRAVATLHSIDPLSFVCECVHVCVCISVPNRMKHCNLHCAMVTTLEHFFSAPLGCFNDMCYKYNLCCCA